MSCRRWTFLTLNKEIAGSLSEECGLDPVLCLLLTGRGITDAESAMQFLGGDELRSDPYLFADMDLAVERIQRAMDNGESIMVYGDYDADGVTATVLLYSYLKLKGARVDYMLPHREGDGYGLHRHTVERMAAKGVSLIITVDNGIAAVEEVAYAAELGMDVVVTDHHMPPDVLPDAVAVVDPHREDCPSEFKDFAGVGVAFQLLCALEGDTDVVLEQFADLVALGTLADVMPLRDDNRVLVRRGVERIARGARVGLQKLRQVAGAGDRPQTATTVTFTLAPRINAAGRMGDPTKAAELLLGEDNEGTRALAGEIHEMNTARQAVEGEILAQVMAQLDAEPERLAQRVLVVWGEGWHHGVLGIIAARLLERYGKPTVVLSSKDGIARGSGRSLKGFSLYDALCACETCLLGYGGHEQAAGVTVESARLAEFAEAINAYAAVRYPVMPTEELVLDCRLRPSQLTTDLLDCLAAMEPFGAGNPLPIFGLYGMKLEKIDPVGAGKHLRLTLSRDGRMLTAMKFSTAPETFPFVVGDTVNLAVTLDKNEFRGNVTVSVIIKDMRYSDTDQEELIAALALRDAIVRRDEDTADVDLPSRETAAALYRFLKRAPFEGDTETLHHALSACGATYVDIVVCLQLLREANLITVRDHGRTMCITVNETAQKVDLFATPTAQFLQQRRNERERV